nr:MAG TPA: hypothetical protein [Caudoviricetes sp.]
MPTGVLLSNFLFKFALANFPAKKIAPTCLVLMLCLIIYIL